MKAKLQFFQNSSTTLHSERVTGFKLFDFVSQLFYMHCKGAVPAVIKTLSKWLHKVFQSQNSLLCIIISFFYVESFKNWYFVNIIVKLPGDKVYFFQQLLFMVFQLSDHFVSSSFSEARQKILGLNSVIKSFEF